MQVMLLYWHHDPSNYGIAWMAAMTRGKGASKHDFRSATTFQLKFAIHRLIAINSPPTILANYLAHDTLQPAITIPSPPPPPTMFLIPSHIRKTLGSVLTESTHQGPHTGLILLPHGQVLCSITNEDEDWDVGSGGTSASGSLGDEDEDGDDEDDVDNAEDDDNDEDEPYIPTPERNRMLRGIVNTQLLESNAFPLRPSSSSAAVAGGSGSGSEKKRSSLKIECEVSPSTSSPHLTTLNSLH
jgi:hypothetical protein